MREKRLVGLLVAAFVLRVTAALLLPSIHFSDEIWQYLEPGHRMAFGYGGVPWEYYVGARSWLLPGALGMVMYVCGLIASEPAVYLVTIQLLLALLSLAPVAVGYLLANRVAGCAAAIAAATLLAFWPEMVYFAIKPLPGVVAAHVLLLALWAVYPAACPKGTVSNRRWFLGGILFGLAAALRIQLLPAIGVALLIVCGLRWARWTALAAGAALSVGAAGLLDAVTWGYPFYSFYQNFRFNMLEGVSASFGVSPWYSYAAGLIFQWLWGLPVIAWLFLREFRSMVLPAVMALAIGVSFTLIPHKEYRYIYPAIPLVLLVAGTGAGRWWSGTSRRGSPMLPVLMALAIGVSYALMLQKEYRFVYAAIPLVLLIAGAGAGRWWSDRSRPGFPLVPAVGLGILALSLAPFLGPIELGSSWLQFRPEIQAFSMIRSAPDLCGLALRVDWRTTGGYSYLHRQVPILPFADDSELEENAPSYNYLLAGPDTVPPPGYGPRGVFWGQDGTRRVFARPGGCESPTAKTLNEVMMEASPIPLQYVPY